MTVRFKPYSGDLIGLPTSDNHLSFRWIEPSCKILFSVCRQGNAASCHLATDKKGLRKLKQAINEYCDFVFWLFDWCKMIIGKVEKDSIGRILKKCSFKLLGNSGKVTIYVRAR